MRTFHAVLFVVLFAVISFLPQPVLEKAGPAWGAACAAAVISAILMSRCHSPFIGRRDAAALLFVICLGAGSLNALNSQVALHAYSMMALIFANAYYAGKSCARAAGPGRVAAVVCACMTAVAVIGFIEIAMGGNVIYERFVPNSFYLRYTRFSSRPMATLYNPVAAGSYMAGCLPFAFYFLEGKRGVGRAFGCAALYLGIAFVILCASRGVFLAMVASLACYLALRKKVFLAAACVAVALFFVAGASFSAHPAVRQFGFQKLVIGSHDSIVSKYRADRVAMAIRMLRDRPVIGAGLGHFRLRFDEYSLSPQGQLTPYELMIPDNMFMSILAEAGLIGAVGFVLFLWHIFTAAGIRRREDKTDQEPVRIAALSGFIGLLVNMAAYDLFYWHTPFALFCFLAGLATADIAPERKRECV